MQHFPCYSAATSPYPLGTITCDPILGPSLYIKVAITRNETSPAMLYGGDLSLCSNPTSQRLIYSTFSSLWLT
jgi:hypothetical protein